MGSVAKSDKLHQLGNLFCGIQDAKSTCAECNALRTFAVDSCVFSDVLEPYVPKLYDCMRQHLSDVSVQKCAVMALASLGEKKGLRWQLVFDGRLGDLLDVWKRHQIDESLVKDVLVLLRTVSAEEASRSLLCDSDVIPCTIQCMTLFPQRPSLLSYCISLLTNLTYDASVAKSLVCGNGGVKALFVCLRRFQTVLHTKLHGKGCALLKNLSSDCEVAQELIIAEDGVDYLRNAFLRHRANCDVVEQSLSALRNLACSSRQYFEITSVYSPLLEELVRFLVCSESSQAKYGRAHELCISLLSAVASENSVLQEGIGELGGVAAVIDVTHAHLMERQDCGHALACSVPQRAAVFLRRMAFVAGNRVILRASAHGIHVLVELVRKLRTESLLVEQALLALGNNLFDSEVGKARLLELNGVCAILSVMTTHPHVSGLQDACCLSLRAVCDGSRANSDETVKLGGIEAFIHVLRTYNENATLQEHGLATLIVLVQNSGIGVERYRSSIQEVACAAAETFRHSPVIKAQRALLNEELDESGLNGKPRRRSRFILPLLKYQSRGE